ncbi:GNAT family N-acetyltransferase [Marivirga sp. S37H4]|uniref:GNAT family N-acetyltransferase n=1 Tax=Marivirga aurantiaca TaxID=2802615 RepID=A0A934X063_9BACT|nr:GNAT family N-acetyltransferase [Marivirga aurantiaca]MBK6266087.1 GNAT family N-acetyltransferase [Marivirga aurantiaca]
MEIKNINISQIEKATSLLSESFVDDKGMKALFARNDPRYKQKLYAWFKATLKMEIRNKQLLWAAYEDEKLISLASINDTSLKMSGLSMLKWLFSIGFSCGLRTVVKTISHDQERQKHYPQKQLSILEFIAVDPEHRGKGIGKLMMKKLQRYAVEQSKIIWLETTKPKNVKIFEKSGFHLTQVNKETDVEYFMMVNEEAD